MNNDKKSYDNENKLDGKSKKTTKHGIYKVTQLGNKDCSWILERTGDYETIEEYPDKFKVSIDGNLYHYDSIQDFNENLNNKLELITNQKKMDDEGITT